MAGLVIVIAGVSVWRTLRPISDKFDPTHSLASGQLLAQETAKAIQGQGWVVPVISPDHQQTGGAAHAEWQAFQAVLRKHPGIQLTAPEILTKLEDLPGCSGATFTDILARHSQAGAIVFLTPLQSWLQMKESPPAPPTARIIVQSLPVYSAKNAFAGYFEQKFISVLLYRGLAGGSADYQIFTPDNFHDLPGNPALPEASDR
ncbi:MAG: hypothetical protein PCFJNLEI_02435 [Verrucomicrobiae bacterium]|nr:hypothetical protein [Verrucomicrobiae bacterium]